MPVSMWVMAQDRWALRSGKNGATRSDGTHCAMNLEEQISYLAVTMLIRKKKVFNAYSVPLTSALVLRPNERCHPCLWKQQQLQRADERDAAPTGRGWSTATLSNLTRHCASHCRYNDAVVTAGPGKRQRKWKVTCRCGFRKRGISRNEYLGRKILLTLMPSCLCVVGPLVSLFSCSVRWIPFVRKFVFVALSALGFVFPTFNFTFWKSSCLFFFLDFISEVFTAEDVNRHAGETNCIDNKNR